jgi:hypothetical protein
MNFAPPLGRTTGGTEPGYWILNHLYDFAG